MITLFAQLAILLFTLPSHLEFAHLLGEDGPEDSASTEELEAEVPELQCRGESNLELQTCL